MASICLNNECTKGHNYYEVPHPWFQIKALKIISMLTTNKNPKFKPMLTNVLNKIMNQNQISDVKNKNNINASILFEAVNVVIKYKRVLPLDIC